MDYPEKVEKGGEPSDIHYRRGLYDGLQGRENPAYEWDYRLDQQSKDAASEYEVGWLVGQAKRRRAEGESV